MYLWRCRKQCLYPRLFAQFSDDFHRTTPWYCSFLCPAGGITRIVEFNLNVGNFCEDHVLTILQKPMVNVTNLAIYLK
jgi:hypothetical protein